MASEHGGDLYDFSRMTDAEIYDVVRQHLGEYGDALDPGWIDVFVKDGFVTLAGRVGTDAEIQVAESMLADVLGIKDYSNELVVDELHRGELPEGADEAIVQEEQEDEQVGKTGQATSDTAEHLIQDLDSQTYGTHDLGTAIREGTPYVPPDRPVSDGYDSRENH